MCMGTNNTVSVKVIPKAKMQRVKEEIATDGSVRYKIYVTAAPEDGKANEAVIKLLSKVLGVSKTSLVIIRGYTSREKTIRIDDALPPQPRRSYT